LSEIISQGLPMASKDAVAVPEEGRMLELLDLPNEVHYP
jgi:hypothetical protein